MKNEGNLVNFVTQIKSKWFCFVTKTRRPRVTAETELGFVGLSFCFCTAKEQNPTSTSWVMTNVSETVFSLLFFFLLYYYYYLLFVTPFFFL